VNPENDQTRVVYRPAAAVDGPRVEIVTSPEERELGEALRRAVMREGVAADPELNRAVQIVFAGGVATGGGEANPEQLPWARDVLVQVPQARGELRGNVLLVHVPMRVTDERAPAIVSGIIRHAFAPAFAGVEPRRIDAATLSAWSRPATGAPASVLPADEGDRRWLWGLALALLGVEAVMRRRARA
jgi:hypothetical protein